MTNRERIQESLKFQDLCRALKFEELADKEHRYMLSTVAYTPKQTRFAWVGVNPPADQFADLLELYKFAIEHLPYDQYELVVEQHTDGGVRPHIHLLVEVKATTRKNHMIARLARIFKIQENFISVNITSLSSLVERYRSYMRGEKCLSKSANVVKDQEIRERLGIPHLYKKISNSNVSLDIEDVQEES